MGSSTLILALAGCLQIVLADLAGSERLAKTGSRGTAQREALHINRSLSFLEQVSISLPCS